MDKVNDNEFVILLTGCINPGNMLYTSLTDNHVRLSQYLNAINYYLNETKYKVIFVENTNFMDLYSYHKLFESGRFEYLTFDGNNYDRNRGKGYGEMLIIEYALANSKSININSIIVKITGRLLIDDIFSHCKFYEKKNKSISKLIICETDFRTKIAESRIFIGSFDFYKNFLIPLKEELNDSRGIYFEIVLAKAIRYYVNSCGKHFYFNKSVIINGISGTTGKPYTNDTNVGRIRRYIKSILFVIYTLVK